MTSLTEQDAAQLQAIRANSCQWRSYSRPGPIAAETDCAFLLRLLDARPHDAEFVTKAKYMADLMECGAQATAAEQRVAELERDVAGYKQTVTLQYERGDRLAAEVASAHGLQARAEAAEARVVELQRQLGEWITQVQDRAAEIERIENTGGSNGEG